MSNASVDGGKKGKQDYETPEDFFEAVNKIWPITCDLAAHKDNHKTIHYFTEEDDSLSQPWHKIDGWLWLNPPFENTKKWMKKCKEESRKGAKIISLTLANTATNWYLDHVYKEALTLILIGRLQFVGQKFIYPKELMINVWGNNIHGSGYWDWKKKEKKA